MLRAEYAIGDPGKAWWWRDFADCMAAPNTHEPSVFYRRGPADDALGEARTTVDAFGLAYTPHLFVRTRTTGTDGTEVVSGWRPAEAGAQ
jgi:hypothetical protein